MKRIQNKSRFSWLNKYSFREKSESTVCSNTSTSKKDILSCISTRMITYKQKGNMSVSYGPLINPLQFLRHNMPDELIKRNAAGM